MIAHYSSKWQIYFSKYAKKTTTPESPIIDQHRNSASGLQKSSIAQRSDSPSIIKVLGHLGEPLPKEPQTTRLKSHCTGCREHSFIVSQSLKPTNKKSSLELKESIDFQDFKIRVTNLNAAIRIIRIDSGFGILIIIKKKLCLMKWEWKRGMSRGNYVCRKFWKRRSHTDVSFPLFPVLHTIS